MAKKPTNETDKANQQASQVGENSYHGVAGRPEDAGNEVGPAEQAASGNASEETTEQPEDAGSKVGPAEQAASENAIEGAAELPEDAGNEVGSAEEAASGNASEATTEQSEDAASKVGQAEEAASETASNGTVEQPEYQGDEEGQATEAVAEKADDGVAEQPQRDGDKAHEAGEIVPENAEGGVKPPKSNAKLNKEKPSDKVLSKSKTAKEENSKLIIEDVERQRENILKKTANDIFLLIAHLSRQERFNGEGIGTIYGLAKKAEAGDLPDNKQQEFWEGYSKLIEAAKPARVDSLYYDFYARSLGFHVNKGSRNPLNLFSSQVARSNRSPIEAHLKKINFMLLLAAFAFGCTILLTAYVATTQKLIRSTINLSDEFKGLLVGRALESSPLYTIVTTPQSFGAQIQTDTASAPATNSEAEFDGSVTGATEISDATDTGAVNSSFLAERTRELIDARLNEIFQEILRNDRWLYYLNFVIEIPDGYKNELPRRNYIIPDRIRSIQQEVNDIINTYLLPLFASILGVCVYILRSSSKNFSDLSFAAREVPSYTPRVILGVIGGLVAGWLFSSESSSLLIDISPVALAFVIGYSIEVFFNILDSIVSTLSPREKSD